MTPLPLTRLSDRFLLLDFLYGHGTYKNVNGEIDLSCRIDDEHLCAGKHLCKNLLEPVVKKYGPISVGEGLRMKGVPKETANTPHEWTRSTGAAADVVVHDWVNDKKAPINFLRDLSKKGIHYHRVKSYAGSEYCCVAYKTSEMDYRLNENRLDEGKKEPGVRSLGYEEWKKLADRPLLKRKNWRREPYRHYHYGREVRPWHVRVSRYFVLHDFLRNEKMFSRGMATVPELNEKTAKSEIKVARMLGEVLDPVKKLLGNLSVVRGWEPERFAADGDRDEKRHRWIAGHGKTHSVRFVTPVNPVAGYLDLLNDGDRVKAEVIGEDLPCDGHLVRVDIEDFDPSPSRCFTSASGTEFPWEAED